MKYIQIFEKYQSETDILKVLKEKYFNSEYVNFNLKQTDGYKFNFKEGATFGSSYSYNNVDIFYLLHEMGHFVSFKDYSRLLKNTYGLDYTTKVKHDKISYDLPITWKAIQNELKAVSYQEVLALHFFDKFPLQKWIDSFYLMEDFINVPPINSYKKDYVYYDNQTDEKINYNDLKKRRLETLYKYYENYKLDNKDILNMKNFDKQWFNRVSFIEKNCKNNI